VTKQAVTLTCRLVSLWFFFYAGLALLEFAHAGYMAATAASGAVAFVRHNDISFFGFAMVQAIFELGVGALFYGCGPGVVRFLFRDTLEAERDSA
jgi:hypothetical protein